MSLRSTQKWTVKCRQAGAAVIQGNGNNRSFIDYSNAINPEGGLSGNPSGSTSENSSGNSSDVDSEDNTVSSNEAEEDTSSGEEEPSEIQVDFEYYPLQRRDFSTIQTLLDQLLEPLALQEEPGHLDGTWNLNKFNLETALTLTKPLLDEKTKKELQESSHYGNTVKNSEDDPPLAILSLIRLARKGITAKTNLTGIQIFINFLAGANPSLHDFFRKHSNSTFGIFIKLQSVLNTPPQVAIPLYRLFLEDEKQDPEELKCSYYLWIVRTFRMIPSVVDHEVCVQEKKKRKKENLPLEFYYDEDSILKQFADFSCPLQLKPVDQQKHHRPSDAVRLFTDDGVQEERNCFILSRENFLKYIETLANAFCN